MKVSVEQLKANSVMPHWETVVYTYNPKTGDKSTFAGDLVEAPSQRLAQMWLNLNGKGYMQTTGHQVLYEIDCDTNEVTNYGYFNQN